MNNDKINFHLPDFITGRPIYEYLISLIISNSDMLRRDDLNIGAIFGNFPNCTWNGGSIYFDNMIMMHEMAEIIKYYNSYGIPLRLTMTNCLLEERDIYDRYGNMIMKLCENDLNEVLVVSDVLEEHIRKEYPRYKIIKSIINTKDQPYFIDDKYHMSVIARWFNTYENLSSIPEEHRHKLEILVNEGCPIDCPRTYTHYKDFAKVQLFQHDVRKSNRCENRFNNLDKLRYVSRNQKSYIQPDEIFDKYVPLGYRNFKISGRNSTITIIENIADYFIKPEYQQDFRCKMQAKVLNKMKMR